MPIQPKQIVADQFIEFDLELTDPSSNNGTDVSRIYSVYSLDPLTVAVTLGDRLDVQFFCIGKLDIENATLQIQQQLLRLDDHERGRYMQLEWLFQEPSCDLKDGLWCVMFDLNMATHLVTEISFGDHNQLQRSEYAALPFAGQYFAQFDGCFYGLKVGMPGDDDFDTVGLIKFCTSSRQQIRQTTKTVAEICLDHHFASGVRFACLIGKTVFVPVLSLESNQKTNLFALDLETLQWSLFDTLDYGQARVHWRYILFTDRKKTLITRTNSTHPEPSKSFCYVFK
ncbi:hypothetical protein M3Y96_00900700 [Aphelenchoides besseyi]|nr:hypothetical protein M3Y96_00900700 [Aphelenchoides besseyi]